MVMPNRRDAECERCGSAVVEEIVPDFWDDAPKRFTMTRTCSGSCRKTYARLTPEKMHELTGLPLTGWFS